jgi:hypothetical protein
MTRKAMTRYTAEGLTFQSARAVTHAVMGTRLDGEVVICATAGSRELAEKALRTQVSYLTPNSKTGGDTTQKRMYGHAGAFRVVPVEVAA